MVYRGGPARVVAAGARGVRAARAGRRAARLRRARACAARAVGPPRWYRLLNILKVLTHLHTIILFYMPTQLS